MSFSWRNSSRFLSSFSCDVVKPYAQISPFRGLLFHDINFHKDLAAPQHLFLQLSCYIFVDEVIKANKKQRSCDIDAIGYINRTKLQL
jgi:hypothetical protein